MAGSRRVLVVLASLCMALLMFVHTGITVEAGSNRNYLLNELNAGVASILNPSATNTAEILNATKQELQIEDVVEDEEDNSTLVMANVKSALNLRSEAREDAKKVGKLYKDCGGIILEKTEGWTKLQTGNAIGWAKDEYLLFGAEAEALANEVGKTIATISGTTVRVRQEPNTESVVYGLLPKGEIAEVIEETEGWVCIDYEGKNGYVSTEYVELDFWIDAGETTEEIKAREEAEKEAKRHVNYGQYTTDADTTLLLAALIHCEARGESYEGQVAVGAVVMNRVRSSAYPNTIHGVIYASGQFTPAMSGAVNRVLESGKINESCIRAAEEALSGVSPVGDCTRFRRDNGTRQGIILGHHVFF